jgi:cytoskeletal protein RodZ
MTRSPRTAEQLDARALARSRREAMRRRARRIRRSVAGLAVTLFAVAFLIVYVQLASGHDPALVANAKRRAATATSTASSTTSSESSGEETSSESSSSDSGETSTGASAVTTSQS